MGGHIERISGEIADIILQEGIDYTQTKAVFRDARKKAGLKAPKEKRTFTDAPGSLSVIGFFHLRSLRARGRRAGR